MNSYSLNYSLESYFGQVRYNYDDKYFLHGIFRRDGSSKFIGNNKWGNFWSVGGAWILNREGFLTDVNWLKFLKFRLSYGVTGNQDLVVGNTQANYYPYSDLYSISNLNDDISVKLAYKGNSGLTWESTKIFNPGIDFNINNVIEGEIEYSHRRTDNMLFNKQVAPSLGYVSIPVNDGVLLNQELDLSLVYHALKAKDVRLDVRLNAAFLSNKMDRMPKDAKGNLKVLEVTGAYGYSKGHSIYDYYIREYAGVNPSTGDGEWYIYYDKKASGDPIAISNFVDYASKNEIEELVIERTSDYDKATLNYVGKSAIPDVYGGFGFDLSIRDFDFSATFSYGIGGYAYDNIYANQMDNGMPGANAWHKDILNRWQKEGDITDVPRLSANYDNLKISDTSSRFLVSKSYLHLSNVRLAYNIPENIVSKMKLNSLNIWVSGDNLLLFTKRKGLIPFSSESGSSDVSRYTPTSALMAGVKFQF